jgi:hypothetical protein
VVWLQSRLQGYYFTVSFGRQAGQMGMVQQDVYQKLMDQILAGGFVVTREETTGARLRLSCAMAKGNLEEFDIFIDEQGSLELQVEALKGRTCLAVVKLFEQMVGEIKRLQHSDPCFNSIEPSWRSSRTSCYDL